jgi:protein mago nashi
LAKSIFFLTRLLFREDDTNWPKKNIVGKQELEIRVGNDHIAF